MTKVIFNNINARIFTKLVDYVELNDFDVILDYSGTQSIGELKIIQFANNDYPFLETLQECVKLLVEIGLN